MDQTSKDYFHKRELMERAAAKRATSPEARRVHQELAQAYAASLKRIGDRSVAPAEGGRSRLTIVTRQQ